MADPEKKEGLPDTPPAAAASGVVQELGLDKLDDKATQGEVASYFEKKAKLTDLTHEKQKNLRALLEKDMEKFNTTRAGSAEIIQSIVQKILEDARERDLNEEFYPLFKKTVLEDVKPDLEGDDNENNAVFKKAWLNVAAILKTVPLTVKRQYLTDYAKELIEAYVKKMDELAEPYMLNIGTLKEKELKDIKPLSFLEWSSEPGRPSKDELMLTIHPSEAKAYVEGVSKVKSALEELRSSITGVPNALAEYFTQEAKAIEGFMTDNPNKAMTAIGAAMAGITAAAALESIKTKSEEALKEVETLKGQVTDLDATIEAGYKGLQEKVDKSYQDFLTSKDAKKMDVTALQREKAALDAKLAALKRAPSSASPGGDAPAGAAGETPPAEVPNPAKDPEGFIKKMAEDHPIVFGILTMLGFDKIFSRFFKKKEGGDSSSGSTETASKSVGAASGAAGGSTEKSAEKPSEKDPVKAKEQAEKLARAEKRFKDRFHLTTDEMKLLTPMQVPDFLKLADPPRGVDKTRFEALKKALQKNAADEKTTGTILEYYAKQENEWKAS